MPRDPIERTSPDGPVLSGNVRGAQARGVVGRNAEDGVISMRRAATAVGRLVGGPTRRLAILIFQWRQRGAERRLLHRLSDHVLNDVGVSRRDVEGESHAAWFGK